MQSQARSAMLEMLRRWALRLEAGVRFFHTEDLGTTLIVQGTVTSGLASGLEVVVVADQSAGEVVVAAADGAGDGVVWQPTKAAASPLENAGI